MKKGQVQLFLVAICVAAAVVFVAFAKKNLAEAATPLKAKQQMLSEALSGN